MSDCCCWCQLLVPRADVAYSIVGADAAKVSASGRDLRAKLHRGLQCACGARALPWRLRGPFDKAHFWGAVSRRDRKVRLAVKPLVCWHETSFLCLLYFSEEDVSNSSGIRAVSVR